MKVSVITLFPKMISGFFEESIVKRAMEKKLVEIELVNLRHFAVDQYGSVDDKPYGGGVGMVLRVEPIWKAVCAVIPRSEATRDLIKNKNRFKKIPPRQLAGRNDRRGRKIILTSPKGQLYRQEKAREFSKFNHLIIIAGHYEGVDERVLDFVDEEVSLGDFVLTGGEIAAAAIVDSVVRLLPGVLKKDEATKQETFFEISIDQLIKFIGENETLNNLQKKGAKKVRFLEYPQYTRPEEFQGKKVPKILLSGNHQEIEKWRLKKAFEETLKKRKDLLV